MTTEQLYLIRDPEYIPDPSSEKEEAILSPLQRAALAFAHYSTATVKVPVGVTLTLAKALASIESPPDTLLVECASIVSSYNMVSRFLVSLDVAGLSFSTVPWPYTFTEHRIPLPVKNDENGVYADGAYLHAETYVTDPNAPWIVCCNSLLTNTGMWQWALAKMLAPRPGGKWLGKYKTYNVLLHDQRGHGKSPSSPGTKCTIPLLASDIAFLVSTIILPSGSSVRSSGIPPIHAIVGVSQGGAAALAFAAMYPSLTKSIISCDTGPRTPEGNKQAWEERIEFARSAAAAAQGDHQERERAGMAKLAEITLPRWFPAPSACSIEMYPPGEQNLGLTSSPNPPSINGLSPRITSVISQVTSTPLESGFVLGAGALKDYNLIDGVGMSRGLLDVGKNGAEGDPKVLLVAGSLDGGGKVALGMGKLRDSWNATRAGGGDPVHLEVIPGAGHVPMVDSTEKWWDVVGPWLEKV